MARQPKVPEVPAPVSAEQAVRVVLDDRDAAARRDREDGVHLAADAGVVHGHDGPGARRDETLELALVQVQRVGADVGEDGPGAAQHEGVDRRDEGEGGHDDLVAGRDAQEQRRHLEGVRAGGRQERGGHAQRLREEGVAGAGELAVAGEMAARDGPAHVLLFPPRQAGPVEGDRVGRAGRAQGFDQRWNPWRAPATRQPSAA